jgi:hypothetical protein
VDEDLLIKKYNIIIKRLLVLKPLCFTNGLLSSFITYYFTVKMTIGYYIEFCKSTYIRSRRACDKFASTDVFLAIWRREGGTRYKFILFYIIKLLFLTLVILKMP